MNQSDIVLPQNLYDELLQICRLELPYEACGLLVGTPYQIESIWPMKNELNSPNRFFVSKPIVEETIEKVKSLKRDIIAIYHSHPSTLAIPSRIDIINHLDESVDMVIISLKENEPIMKWYSIVGLTYKERPFLVI